MTANVMYLTRKEAFFLLDTLIAARDKLVKGEGDEQRVNDEKSYDLLNGMVDELVNYSADHCRTIKNQTVQVYKEAVENKDPATLNKIMSLEISWDKAMNG